jgi:hypothetical protein
MSASFLVSEEATEEEEEDDDDDGEKSLLAMFLEISLDLVA